MSLSAGRTFLRERMDLLEFTEWANPFDSENVPDSQLDKTYQITSPSASGISLNQNDQIIEFENNIHIFRKGYQSPAEAVDSILADIEEILSDLLAPAQRLGGGHLNIIFGGFTIEPLNDDNNNSVKATINVRIKVALAVT